MRRMMRRESYIRWQNRLRSEAEQKREEALYAAWCAAMRAVGKTGEEDDAPLSELTGYAGVPAPPPRKRHSSDPFGPLFSESEEEGAKQRRRRTGQEDYDAGDRSYSRGSDTPDSTTPLRREDRSSSVAGAAARAHRRPGRSLRDSPSRHLDKSPSLASVAEDDDG